METSPGSVDVMKIDYVPVKRLSILLMLSSTEQFYGMVLPALRIFFFSPRAWQMKPQAGAAQSPTTIRLASLFRQLLLTEGNLAACPFLSA
jgi:hypothetical protein